MSIIFRVWDIPTWFINIHHNVTRIFPLSLGIKIHSCQFAGSEIMHNKKVEIKDYSQKCDTKLKEEVYLQVIGYVDKSFVTREVV